jgi:hypothetical protein
MPVLWTSPSASVTVINGDATTPTLKNLSSGSTKLGDEVDGATDLVVFADFELQVRFASSPTAGRPVELYIVEAFDGTNYADGSDSVLPAGTSLAGAFLVRAVSTQQRIAISGVRLPPFKWKPLIRNNGGQNFTNTDDENVLRMRTYGLDVSS